MKDSGLIENDEMCQLEPCQIIEWLGLLWNAVNSTISLTDWRTSSMFDALHEILKKDQIVSAGHLASFVSKIISSAAVFGNLTGIMTRYYSISIAAASDLDSNFRFDQYWVGELYFWKNDLEETNCKSFDGNSVEKSNYIVCSDASSTGCWAHLNLNGEKVCHRLWYTHESRKSSTWRELTAVELALQSFLPLKKGTYLK